MKKAYEPHESVPDTTWTKTGQIRTEMARPTLEREKILTTSSPYQKEALTPSPTFDLNQLRLTDHFLETQTTPLKRTPQRNEDYYVEELRKFFYQSKWQYREQWKTKSGNVIDFLVKAPHNGGHIFFGVECKKDMSMRTAATTFADHFEQAVGYAKDLKMPVFLGPVYFPGSASAACLGGHTIRSVSALNIFGGRMNVGTIIYRTGFNPTYNYNNWYLMMRGDVFWEPPNGFNDSRLNYVVSTGSKKERIPLKVWK
jgi:hypothetical protein